MNRKPYPPGRTVTSFTRISTYGMQLREKQKVKRVYGLTETQMKNTLDKAARSGGDKGLRLLQLLEMRLDNVVYLIGLAPSRAAARQAVTHGKISVNGKKMSIPSYVVSVGDKVEVRDNSFLPIPVSALKTPGWLKKKAKAGEIASEPTRDMIDDGINENLIIEFYSR